MTEQNSQGGESADLYRWRVRFRSAAIIGTVVVSMGVALFAENYIDPILVWGGYRCEGPANGMQGCFGYPPAGILLIMYAIGAIMFTLSHVAEQLITEK